MAIAGLHNISSFGPSLFGESQSPVSRQWGDEASRPNSQPPSLLQVWREIEGDNVSHRSRNGSDSQGLSISMSLGQRSDNEHYAPGNADETGSEMDYSDNNSIMSEQSSSDLGEIERERVRQIFREWNINSDAKGHFPSNHNRIIPNNREGPQIKRACDDGPVIAHSDIGLRRRPIRRLCGRQSLLDLLMKFQCERNGEIQCLLEQRPVSDFAHRNRIQALLRGRFLRNERVMPEKGPSSVASTELGLLRRRHTVSGLREGFLSKLDNSASTSANTAESDSSVVDVSNGELDYTCNEIETAGILTSSDLENDVIQVTQVDDPVSHEENEQQVSLDNDDNGQDVSLDVGIAQNRDERVSDSELTQQESSSTHVEDEIINAVITSESTTLETEDTDEVISVHIADVDRNIDERFDRQVDSAQVDEFQQNSVNDIEESQHDDLQEAINSWLELPSGEAGASSITGPAFYFPDEDGAHGSEIRELFSRGRVSSLLRSGFRESLDQVLQSRVERQGRASGDTSSSHDSLVEQDQGQNGHSFAPTSNIVGGSHPFWDEYEGANLPRISSNQQLGMEWEVVNQLRLDMARLQQRMDNMQSILEQCIDMQIELQRSVQQEVSAALNRPISTIDASDNTPFDESKWDYVRRGICCLCCHDNIDSLLYRCGHMCACSKCAEKLVEGAGKCPMCHAPVVEVVRAYFIQ
ncbi:PREDICTED: uncharacterized protein LOC105958548 isoform X1 [Erythranthe guttata]|uniref:uncharacterized protein LOC105958548 isoform X1 n=1 Tax=Erythranthe guttata TaxID=4155 RepID=UPI00064E0B5A|nr:PREDICTED: uncharacterized protein LOC105958548 isoform X1 [Erythranthe guttata]|eukprot:XP_012838002.1 PREDICTED: uncharacterized protein LOC105958548 isoform X1 [Erythranthe guttata]